MSRLAHWCYERRRGVLAAWIVALIGLMTAVLSAGTAFTTSTTLPDSESSAPYALLVKAGVGGDTTNGTIVWRTDGVAVTDPAVEKQVSAMLDEVSALPGVEAIVSPYSEVGSAHGEPGREHSLRRGGCDRCRHR